MCNREEAQSRDLHEELELKKQELEIQREALRRAEGRLGQKNERRKGSTIYGKHG